jgi:polyisoprenyl-teichoic acid--peptidoglycan teichoic acid transferase
MKKKKSVGKIIGIVAGCIVAAIAVFGVSCYLILLHYINKRNYVPTVENFTILDETPSFIEDVLNPTSTQASTDTDKKEVESYKNNVESQAENTSESDEQLVSDVYNILLVGSDVRPGEQVGRSDTMILVSINKETKRIVATSFLRDTYVKIPIKNEFHKLNAAYAFGGIELLFETLQYNYSVNVDRYVAVDFLSFIDAIDILGGLDVQVYEDELYWFNQYIHASNLLVEPAEREHSDYVDHADGSYQHLNGKQALAYARFRYVGNGDFTRTDRQRRVVQNIFDKVKTMDVATLVKLLDSIIPQITTNLTTDECMDLIAMLPEISKYEIISWHIPDDDFKYMTIDGDDVVAIDFSYYMKKLYNYIYTDTEPETK